MNVKKPPRVYCGEILYAKAEFEISGPRHHHLARVLRLKAGGQAYFFNHERREFLCELRSVHRHRSVFLCRAEVEPLPEPRVPVHLHLARCKGACMDFAVQKAVELGVSGICLLDAERSPPRSAGKRVEHWNGVATGAAEQCGRVSLPVLTGPVEFSNLAKPPADEAGFVLDPGAAVPLGAAAAAVAPPGVQLLVGPEGGLTTDEIEYAQAQGFQPVRLGPRTLRVETAAAAGITLLQYLFGDLVD